MRLATVPWTKFLRDPRQVTKELDRSDVVLRRRDEPDLQLTLADRAAGRAESLEVVAALLKTLVADASVKKRLQIGLEARFAWIRVMPPEDQAKFLEEFIECAETAGQLSDMAALAQLVHEWKATAAIYADPWLTSRLSGGLTGSGGKVPRP